MPKYGFDPLAQQDPLPAMIARTGEILGRGAQMAGQTYGKYRQNREQQDLKTALRDGVLNVYQKIGLQPRSLPDPSREDISFDDYKKSVGMLVSQDFKNTDPETLMNAVRGSLSDLAADPYLQQAYKDQSVVQTIQQKINEPIDPLSTQERQQENELTGLLGNVAAPGGPGAQSVERTPMSTKGEDDPILSLTLDLAKKGHLPGEKLADMYISSEKTKQAEIKAEEAKRKERQQAISDKAAGAVVEATGQFDITKNGQPLSSYDPLDVYTDPSGYGIGTEMLIDPNKGRGGSGGGSGGDGNRDKPTASWVQYKDVEAQLGRLRSGVNEFGEKVPFSESEYQAKQYEAATNLLSHYLEVSGMTYDDAQRLAVGTIDGNAVIDNENRTLPYLLDGENRILSLNLANGKTLQALIRAAQEGKTASDILAVLRRSKGLNPSRQQ